MPKYSFHDKKTKRVKVVEMMISEYDDFVKNNPDLEALPTLPSIHSGRGMSKPSQWFRDRLKEIKKIHKKGTFDVY